MTGSRFDLYLSAFSSFLKTFVKELLSDYLAMKYSAHLARVPGRLALGLIFLLAAALPGLAQTTPGGTVVTNSATINYTEPTGNTVTTATNTVSFTVANVSGLAITPDAGTNPTVVPGQTGVIFNFTV